MPFTANDNIGSYTPSQLEALRKVYDEVCEILGYAPSSDKSNEIIAKAVIRMHEQGTTNPEDIAVKITDLKDLLF